jgi:hypothetical protein
MLFAGFCSVRLIDQVVGLADFTGQGRQKQLGKECAHELV